MNNKNKKFRFITTYATLVSLSLVSQLTPAISKAEEISQEDNLVAVNPEQDTDKNGNVIIDNNGEVLRNIHTDNNLIENKDSYQEASVPVVSQGDNVYTPGTGLCTIGYVDKATRKALYAGHCAKKDGEWEKGGKAGKDVIVYDYETRQRIGYVEKNDFSGNLMDGTDFAVIKLDDEISLGENSYSGDKWVTDFSTQVTPGKTVCSYGARTKQPTCTIIKEVYPETNRIRLGIEGAGQKGDSGGPLWIPGEGFVGIFSFFYVGSNGERLDKNFFHISELKNTFGKPVKETTKPKYNNITKENNKNINNKTDNQTSNNTTTNNNVTNVKINNGETVVITIKDKIDIKPLPTKNEEKNKDKEQSKNNSNKNEVNPLTIIGIILATITSIGLIASILMSFFN